MFRLIKGGGLSRSWPLPLPLIASIEPSQDASSSSSAATASSTTTSSASSSVGGVGAIDLPSTIGVGTTLVKNLILLLRHQALGHDFQAAAAILTPILGEPHKYSELLFKMGIAILKQDTKEVSKMDCIRFYRWIHSFGRIKEEVVVSELVMFLMEHQCWTEAMETLESYISIEPFRSNPMLHTFAGISCYRLLCDEIENQKVEIHIKSITEEDEEDEEDDVGQHIKKEKKTRFNEKSQRTLKRAINSLRNAIVLQENQANVSPEGVADQQPYDVAIALYADLLIYSKNLQKARKTLERFKKLFPRHPNSNKLLAVFLQLHGDDSDEEVNVQIQCFTTLIKVDPVSSLAFESLKKFYSAGLVQADELLEHAISRIDTLTSYGPLVHINNEWESFLLLLNQMHFDGLRPLHNGLRPISKEFWTTKQYWFATHFRVRHRLSKSEISGSYANFHLLKSFCDLQINGLPTVPIQETNKDYSIEVLRAMPSKLIVDRVTHLQSLITRIKRESSEEEEEEEKGGSGHDSEDELTEGTLKRRRITKEKRSKRQKYNMEDEEEEEEEKGLSSDKATRLLRCSLNEILDFYTTYLS